MRVIFSEGNVENPSITLNHCSFKYDLPQEQQTPNERPTKPLFILNDINLKIDKPTLTMIVGKQLKIFTLIKMKISLKRSHWKWYYYFYTIIFLVN